MFEQENLLKLLKLLDMHWSAESARKKLVHAFNKLQKRLLSDQDALTAFTAIRQDLNMLGLHADESGLKDRGIHSKSEIKSAKDWLASLEGSDAINHGVLIPGAGKHLDILDEAGIKNPFIEKNMKKLLNHVEVRRQKSLNQYTKEITRSQIIIEKINISILFCRYSLRHQDLRFLNSAFKLNEWLYKHGRKSNHLAHYTLALAEQELCAQELLK